MTADRLEIALRGQVHRRGLIPRVPAAERVLGDIAAWLREAHADQILTLTATADRLQVRLHPAAPPLTVTIDGDGVVDVQARTVAAGPGFHRFVGRALERLGEDVGIEWRIETAGVAFADRAAVERAYLAWLGPALVRVRERVRRGERGIHLELPAGTTYTVEEALATALGPRDETWLEAAIADPRRAIEITPWWSDATDGTYLLARALCLMWLDVRWRRPAIDGEAEVLDAVHRSLALAYPVEPDLAYPWSAWAEVIAFRGIQDAMARQVIARASAMSAAADPAPIGYRRKPVAISHEGWTLTVPGAFAERRSDEEWWGGGAGRQITLAATSTGAGGDRSAQGFLAQVASDLGADALHHRAGDVQGRARITTDTSSGVEVGVLEGYSAVTGSGAAVRIEFDDGEDYAWALEMWRSLRPG